MITVRVSHAERLVLPGPAAKYGAMRSEAMATLYAAIARGGASANRIKIDANDSAATPRKAQDHRTRGRGRSGAVVSVEDEPVIGKKVHLQKYLDSRQRCPVYRSVSISFQRRHEMLKSPCLSCDRANEDKNKCLEECERLREYQELILKQGIYATM